MHSQEITTSGAGKEDIDDPCNECLAEPKNLYSHKPVEYVEDPKRVKMLKKIKMLKKMEGNN